MTSSDQRRPLSLHHPQQATESFAEYRDAERERRRNSGETFDQDLFDEAADLVMRKLRQLEEEGLA
jgi:hypothetical protein